MPETIHVDPTTELAAERTLLAWVRTALAIMGLGFVVARFGLFLREMAAASGHPAGSPHSTSLIVGVALVFLGVIILAVSALRFDRLLVRLRTGNPGPISSGPGVFLSLALSVIGLALAIYLVFAAR